MLSKNNTFTKFLRHNILSMDLKYFTGREAELGVLTDVFESGSRGGGRTAFLHGAVSSGKTFLLNKFVERQEKSGAVFRFFGSEVFCFDSGTDFCAFGFLKDYVSLEDFCAVDDFFRRSALEKPVLLVIDNLNFADAKSLDLLYFILKSLAERPYCMTAVFSVCSDIDIENNNFYSSASFEEKFGKILSFSEIRENFVTQISLPPFKLADVAMYLSGRFSPSGFSSAISNIVREISLSDPLIMSEVSDYMVLSGYLYLSDGKVWKQRDGEPGLAEKISFNAIEQLKIKLLSGKNFDGKTVLENLKILINNYVHHTLMNPETENMLLDFAARMKDKFGGTEFSECLSLAESFYSRKNSRKKSESETEDMKDETEIRRVLSSKDIELVFSALDNFRKLYKPHAVTSLTDGVLKDFKRFCPGDTADTQAAKFELLRYANTAFNWTGNLSKALEYSLLMLETAQKFNLPHRLHQAYYIVGTDYFNLTDYALADENLLKAVNYASLEGDFTALSLYNSQLGMVCIYRQKISDAQKYFFESERLCQKINDEDVIARNKINLGIYYTSVGNFEMAEYYLKPLILFFESSGDKKSLSKTLGCLSIMYQQTEDYELSESYALRAVKTDVEIRDNVSLASHYNNLGLLKFECGKNDEALEYFFKSLKINEFLSDTAKTAICCTNIGDICAERNDTVKASEYYLRAADCYLKVNNTSGASSVFVSLAELYVSDCEYDKALLYFERAAEYCSENSLTEDLVSVYNAEGEVYMVLDDIKNALDSYNRALKISTEANYDSGSITTLYNMGGVFLNINDYEAALKRYNTGLYIAKKNGDKNAESEGYSHLGRFYGVRTEYDAAVLNYNYAVSLDKELKDGFSLAENFSCLGDMYCLKDDMKSAFENYAKAEDIFSAMDEKALLVETMRKTALALSIDGHYNRAVKKIGQALKISDGEGDSLSTALTYIAFADVESGSSHYKKALEYLEKACDFLKKEKYLGDAYFECTDKMAEIYMKLETPSEAVLIHLGQLEILKKRPDGRKIILKYLDIADDYKEQKLNDKAEEYYLLALEKSKGVYDSSVKAGVLFDTGMFYVSTDRFDKGMTMMMDAPKALGGDIRRDYRAADYYNLAGDCQYDADNYEDALECYKLACKIYLEIGDKFKTAYIYNNIGYCYDTLSKFRDALFYYQKAFQYYKAVDDIDGIINNVKNVALMYERLQDYTSALKYCQVALEYLDKLDAPQEKGELCLEAAENCVKATSDYEKSGEYIKKAYAHFKEAENFPRRISCLESSAMLSIVSGDAENAENALARLLREENYVKDVFLKIQIHKAAGNVCFRKSNFNRCMEEYFKAFTLSADLDDWEMMAGVYLEWASVLSSDDSEYSTVIEFQSQKKTLAEYALEYYGNAVQIARSSEKCDKTASDAFLSRALLNASLGNRSSSILDFDQAAFLAKEKYASRYVSVLISKGETVLRKFNLMDVALDCFETAFEAASEHNFTDMKIIAKSYVALIFFMAGHTQEAKIILNEMKDYYEFIVMSVPALTRYL